MHKSLENLNFIQKKVIEIVNRKQQKISPNIIVVTKTFSSNLIKPLLDAGHIHYGENKVQEAEQKSLFILKKKVLIQLEHVLA